MKSRLIIYDTTNFLDFPIGGQLTSVSNFLHYLSDKHTERCEKILLVGVTTKADELGCIRKIQIENVSIEFIPVAVAESDLSHIRKSLRMQYAKGLLHYGKKIKISVNDCNYIQTPEAYGVIKLLQMRATCVIFSHGNYFNMERGFRFFQKNKLIKKGFMCYIKWILHNADLIFVLDNDSCQSYASYNENVIKVVNSIVCCTTYEKKELSNTILYVGRLSKDKNIEPIIEAVEDLDDRYRLVIVGDGEEREYLEAHKGQKIEFVGAVMPNQVKSYMKKADILVMNSFFEGIPMTILEAISLGLPVITTDVGGIHEVLSFGEDSLRTNGTKEQIIQSINSIYSDYNRYSVKAYQNSKQFDYCVVNEQIYEHLVQFWQ